MAFRKPLADRLPHHFEVGTGAMQHHDGGTGRIARADIDDMKGRAGNLDHPALGGMGPLRQPNPGLRDQRQDRQRRHDNRYHH